MTPILVDSSFVIAIQRSGRDIRQILLPFVRAGWVWGFGPIRIEVVRGIRDAVRRAEMEVFLDLLPDIPCDREFWAGAVELAWQCERRGIRRGTTDILIAQAAIGSGSELVTLDADFDEIPGLRWRRDLPRLL